MSIKALKCQWNSRSVASSKHSWSRIQAEFPTFKDRGGSSDLVLHFTEVITSRWKTPKDQSKRSGFGDQAKKLGLKIEVHDPQYKIEWKQMAIAIAFFLVNKKNFGILIRSLMKDGAGLSQGLQECISSLWTLLPSTCWMADNSLRTRLL